MSWIKEVEMAKSLDDLVTSQSNEGRDFPDFEMLDAKMASALKRIISNQYFRRRVDVEGQTGQKYDRFLRTRQIAHMIMQKCEPQERNPCAPKFGDRTLQDTLQQEGCARREAWDLRTMSFSSK